MATNNTGNVSHIRRDTGPKIEAKQGRGTVWLCNRWGRKLSTLLGTLLGQVFLAKSCRKLCPRSCNINAVIYNLHANSQCFSGERQRWLLSQPHSLSLSLSVGHVQQLHAHLLCHYFCGMSLSAGKERERKKIFRRQRLIARACLGLFQANTFSAEIYVASLRDIHPPRHTTQPPNAAPNSYCLSGPLSIAWCGTFAGTIKQVARSPPGRAWHFYCCGSRRRRRRCCPNEYLMPAASGLQCIDKTDGKFNVNPSNMSLLNTATRRMRNIFLLLSLLFTYTQYFSFASLLFM